MTEVEVVQQLFAAVAGGDLDELLRWYDPEVVIEESLSLPYGGTYRGLTGAAAHARAFVSTWQQFSVTGSIGLEPRFVDAGAGTVVVLFRHRVTNSATGRVLDTPEVGVYDVARGKVAHSRMHHLDPAALTHFLQDADVNPHQGDEG